MKRIIFICILSSLLLFVMSFYFANKIFDFIFSFFYNAEYRFIFTGVNDSIVISTKLSVSIALIPLLVMALWAYGKIILLRKKIFSLIIITISIALVFLFNVYRIQSLLNDFSHKAYKSHILMSQLYFEYAVIIGTLLGVIISYFTLRTKQFSEDFSTAISEIGSGK